MLIGALFLVGGLAFILWGAERFTDGAMRTATRFAVSPFSVGAIVSGFEPENLVTGIAAALGDLPQVALGTVIGSAVFLLTAGLGLTLLLVPMPVEIPRAGPVGMLAALTLFAATIFTGGGSVGRAEGALLIAVSVGLLVWWYRRSPVFQRRSDADDIAAAVSATSTSKGLGILLAGALALVVGAELLVSGARGLLSAANLSETFLGMVVVGMGESLEETARMVAPARRGHPELAWGNVVGTTVILLGLNLGLIALIRPLVAEPLVLRFHAPYVIACGGIVAVALLSTRRLGRGMGALLIALFGLYLAVNLGHMWR